MQHGTDAGLERQERARQIAALAAHPDMPAALRALCAGAVDLFERSRLLNIIVSDRARLVMGWLAVYLDAGYQPGNPLSGLTVNRYKMQCAATGLCSQGRAAAMLGLMRFAGHLEPAARTARGQPLRLVPTEKLIGIMRDRWRVAFSALAHVRAEGNSGLALLHHPLFPRMFVRAAADLFFARERATEHGPGVQLFVDRKAGLVVLMNMMMSAAPGDDMPPSGPMSVSVAALARRFAVSRAQIKDILQSAVAAGLLAPAGPDPSTYLIAPQLRHDILHFFAAVLALVADAIAAAEADMRASERLMEGAA
jgi:hypothetical protein